MIAWLLAGLMITFISSIALAQGQSHEVALGENLSGIAAQYGVSPDAILRYNGIANPNLIYVGQHLIIPTGIDYGASFIPNPPSYAPTTPTQQSTCTHYHTVQRGETLSSVARQYGTTTAQLQRMNGLYNPNLVRIGQTLCVPNTYTRPSPPPQVHRPANAYHHVVASGETIYSICDRYGVNVWEVMEANYLSMSSYIVPGQQIYIPDYQPQPPAPIIIVEKESSCGCGDTPHCKCDKPVYVPEPEPISVYMRLGRNVNYEYWGRPDFGLDDCVVDWYDDGDPVLRFTAEVILTNQSDLIIPSDWADRKNVVFHTVTQARRNACKHVGADGSDSMEVTFADLKKLDMDSFPGDLYPSETVNVTFYTHLEEGDLVTKMEFIELGLCFDPNSGDQIPCDF